MTRWRYGDAWERHPIQDGETWRAGTGIVACGDLNDSLPEFMFDCDVLFVDPPWRLNNLNAFLTKAGMPEKRVSSYWPFVERLVACIGAIAPRVVYVEIGTESVDRVAELLPFERVERFGTTYNRGNPCWILRGSSDGSRGPAIEGLDQGKAIEMVARDEAFEVIGDLCMGRGRVGLAAHQAGRSFRGLEINRRRLAVLLDRISLIGGDVRRLDP